jgi:hypothetical protein
MITRVLSRLLLIVVYFVIITPLALIRRVFGNPMQHPVGDMGFWVKRDPASNEAAAMRTLS